MRGIAELMEVMKSGPPTPSHSSLHMSVSSNHVASPLATHPAPSEVIGGQFGGHGHNNNNNDVDLSATPTDMNRIDEPNPQEPPRPPQATQGVENNGVGMGSSTFHRMRSMLALQLSGGSMDSTDAGNISPSPSPSRSPPVTRRKAKTARAPSPPKRDPQTTRHSYSSSSSNQTELVGRPQDYRSSVQIPLTTGKHPGQQEDYHVTNGSKFYLVDWALCWSVVYSGGGGGGGEGNWFSRNSFIK